MNNKRRKFGEVVIVDGVAEAVIVMLNNSADTPYELNSNPCTSCDNPDCREFDNLLTTDGKWIYHISECRMTDAGQ